MQAKWFTMKEKFENEQRENQSIFIETIEL
jgi:hypothetical protein